MTGFPANGSWRVILIFPGNLGERSTGLAILAEPLNKPGDLSDLVF